MILMNNINHHDNIHCILIKHKQHHMHDTCKKSSNNLLVFLEFVYVLTIVLIIALKIALKIALTL